jgi:hypothetical protein
MLRDGRLKEVVFRGLRSGTVATGETDRHAHTSWGTLAQALAPRKEGGADQRGQDQRRAHVLGAVCAGTVGEVGALAAAHSAWWLLPVVGEIGGGGWWVAGGTAQSTPYLGFASGIPVTTETGK